MNVLFPVLDEVKVVQHQYHRASEFDILENNESTSILRRLILTFLGYDGQEKTGFYERIGKGVSL